MFTYKCFGLALDPYDGIEAKLTKSKRHVSNPFFVKENMMVYPFHLSANYIKRIIISPKYFKSRTELDSSNKTGVTFFTSSF